MVGLEFHVSFSISAPGPLYMLLYICEFICMLALLFCYHKSTLPLKNILPSLPHNSLSPDSWGLMKLTHIGLNVPRFVILWTLSNCEALLDPIYFRRKFLWWWVSETLIYGSSRISLEIILSSSFIRTIVFVFLQAHGLYDLKFLAT